jgi:uncharacterized membrane protein YgcG
MIEFAAGDRSDHPIDGPVAHVKKPQPLALAPPYSASAVAALPAALTACLRSSVRQLQGTSKNSSIRTCARPRFVARAVSSCDSVSGQANAKPKTEGGGRGGSGGGRGGYGGGGGRDRY